MLMGEEAFWEEMERCAQAVSAPQMGNGVGNAEWQRLASPSYGSTSMGMGGGYGEICAFLGQFV